MRTCSRSLTGKKTTISTKEAFGVIYFPLAGLSALQGGESGQVRKEAATAIDCECRR